MAELSVGLVNEFLKANRAGRPAPYTSWEFYQLCAAWLKANGYVVPPYSTDRPVQSET